MEIQLKITIDDDRCGDLCMFKHTDVLDRAGKCLLFNEPLRPELRYGNVEYWHQCDGCRSVERKVI